MSAEMNLTAWTCPSTSTSAVAGPVDGREPVGKGPVVVWLKSLFRVHENPVVDVGRWMAHHHGRPLLIYHGLDERYPHASLRHHNVVMDAAVDLHRGFTSRASATCFTLHETAIGHRP